MKRFWVSFRLRLVAVISCTVLLSPIFCLAQGRTYEQIESEVKAKVLPRIDPSLENAKQAADTLQAIHQNEQLQDLVKSSNSMAEVEAKLQAAPKDLFYDNRFGAEPSVVEQTYAQDIEMVANDFAQCQDLGHSFEQVMTEPQRTGGHCYSKVNFPGTPSGLCAKCIPSFPCGCFWLLADLVDYSFPTYKLDASEQPYQSLYLEEDLVNQYYKPTNEAMLDAAGVGLALKNLSTAQIATQLTLASKGITLPNSPVPNSLPDGVNTSMADMPTSLRTTVRDSSRVYSRNLSEPLNLQTEGMWWIPHLPREHMFGSDLPPFLPLVSRSLGLGELSSLASPTLMQKLFQFLAPAGMFTCVENNKRNGKTAIDLDTPAVANFNKDLCLKNVGERFPLSDTRRISITDRTWRGIAKDLDLFLAITPESERHSYIANKDKLLVLRNEKLKRESPGCKPLEEMTRVNIDYDTANIKDIKKGGENTMEMFTGFRGCWGYKGKDEGFWTFIVKWNGGDPLRLK